MWSMEYIINEILYKNVSFKNLDVCENNYL